MLILIIRYNDNYCILQNKNVQNYLKEVRQWFSKSIQYKFDFCPQFLGFEFMSIPEEMQQYENIKFEWTPQIPT